MPDLIASTANNLKKDGWVAGQTWGYEVVVPEGFNYLLADRSRQMTMQEWERLGIRRAGGKPSRARTIAPICWFRPACRDRAS